MSCATIHTRILAAGSLYFSQLTVEDAKSFSGNVAAKLEKGQGYFLAASQLILINAVVDAIVHQTTRSFSKTFFSLLF